MSDSRAAWLAQHQITHLKEPGVVINARFEDRHEPRVWNWIRPWDFDSNFDVGIVGAGLSTTSILPTSCYLAPDAFRLSTPGFTTYSPDFDVDLQTMVVRDLGDVSIPIVNQYEALDRIEDTMEKLWSVDQNKFLILIGKKSKRLRQKFPVLMKFGPLLFTVVNELLLRVLTLKR